MADNATEDKSTDFLSPVITRVLAQFGQDTSTPEVQNAISNVAAQLRKTNPGVDDKTIAANISGNLPALIGSISQTGKVSTGADEAGQLAAYKKQLQDDMQQSRINSVIAPIAFSTNQAANQDYMNKSIDRAYAPSNALAAGMKADQQFYDNQIKKGDAQVRAEQANQEGIKTVSARQDQALKNNLLDTNSPQNQALRTALGQQLKAMGVPDAAIQQMGGMSAPQMQMFAQAFTSTEKERQAINQTIASTLQTKASTSLTQSQTEGANIDNQSKALDLGIQKKATEGYLSGNGTSSGSLEGAPSATFQKYAPKGQQDAYEANTKLLNGLNAGSADRADTLALIDQTLQLVNEGYSGPWANKLSAINPRLQQITKNLASMESKQQVGQSTAAGALSAQAATPDVTKDPKTLRAYLANLKATVQRQESVAQSLNEARTGNSLGTFDVNKEAGGTKSFMLPGGRVVTVSPADIKDGVLSQLQQMGAVPIVDYHGEAGKK